MTLPTPVPGKIQEQFDKMTATQQEVFESLLLGRTDSSWDLSARDFVSAMLQQGFPVGVTTVKDYRRSIVIGNPSQYAVRLGDPKVLILDIETAPASVYTFGLFNQNIGIGQVQDPGHMLSFAAKWYGSKKVEFYSDFHTEGGHAEMVKQAWRLMNEADILVGYNSVGFDVKHLKREFIMAGLTPPAPHRDIDLLRTVRSFKFLSNKLDFASQQLGIGSKVKHEGFGLWLSCMQGDEKAWNRMRRYNKGDVVLTEALLIRLLPWIKNAPHLGTLESTEQTCNKCGSTDLEPKGTHTVSLLIYDRFQCRACGGWVRGGNKVGRAGATYGI